MCVRQKKFWKAVQLNQAAKKEAAKAKYSGPTGRVETFT
jgi:hypothetical protein